MQRGGHVNRSDVAREPARGDEGRGRNSHQVDRECYSRSGKEDFH